MVFSYFYFERLILNHYVNKANRKHVAAACLVLGVKFSDSSAYDRTKMSKLYDSIDKIIGIDKKDVLSFGINIVI